MCSSTSGHDTTMASSYGKTISISTIIIIILPSLSFTSNKTFPLGSHTKSVCVCVLVLSRNFPLLLRNGHTSKMLLSFHSPFFILFHYLYQQQKRAESSNKKKWKLFLISTCELFFTFFCVVSFFPRSFLSFSHPQTFPFAVETDICKWDEKKTWKTNEEKKFASSSSCPLRCPPAPLSFRIEFRI